MLRVSDNPSHHRLVDAVSISQAADRLEVSPQRVSQMLASGHLRGPHIAGTRAPKNAPRVYVDSLDEAIARRRDRQSHVFPPSDHQGDLAVKDDLWRMKVALDAARDQIARQRRQNERLVTLLAETVAALQHEQAMAQESERIAEEYASILTTHLAPETPECPQ